MGVSKRVLVTRAAHQGSALAERLEMLGLAPVLVPAIEIVEPDSFAALDAGLAQLESFGWVVFTSANAVPAFAARLAAREVPPATRVAAIGQATARALEAAGVRVDLVPMQAVAESLAEALLPFACRPDGTPNRFLLIRAEQGREHLPEQLRAGGAEVVVAPAYRTMIPEGSAAALGEVFGDEDAGVGAVAFTSSSSVRNLLALCEAAGVTLPGHVLRISIGPVTSETLRACGLPPHAEAEEATVASLASAVAQALSG